MPASIRFYVSVESSKITCALGSESVDQVQMAEIMNGICINTFDPQDAYTQEQSIITILRLFGVVK